jgi:CDP-diacylglycerol--serine O-phosphatidyltransferase
MKKIAIVPTLCTLGNAACGYASIVYAAQASVATDLRSEVALYISGWLIFAAMIFDALDGYLARRVKSASQFGAELDSLCDAISFGAAPGFLLLQLGTVFQGRLAREVFLLISMLFMMCAILRLARFNVQTTTDVKSHRTFRGLPSPAAAGCVASLVVLRFTFSDLFLVPDEVLMPLIHWVAPLGTLTAALLMVSRVPYPHLTNRILHRRRNFAGLVQLVLAVFAIVLFRELALVFLCWAYALSGPATLLWRRAIPSEAGTPTESHP